MGYGDFLFYIIHLTPGEGGNEQKSLSSVGGLMAWVELMDLSPDPNECVSTSQEPPL